MLDSISSLKETLPAFNILASFLFFVEVYHFIGHVCVLFRIRLLPRKDLVRVKYYFLIDTLSVLVVSFLYTGQLRWLACLQCVQHMFFFFTWNKNSYTNKVISWSSLDWQRSPNQKHYEWDVILGTAFDVVVHLVNAYILSTFLGTIEILVSFGLVQVAAIAVMFNPKFAWTNPASPPAWVEKRIQPVREGREGLDAQNSSKKLS